jgi:hypothetical protein
VGKATLETLSMQLKGLRARIDQLQVSMERLGETMAKPTGDYVTTPGGMSDKLPLSSETGGELVFDPVTGDLVVMPRGKPDLVSREAVVATSIADDGFFGISHLDECFMLPPRQPGALAAAASIILPHLLSQRDRCNAP